MPQNNDLVFLVSEKNNQTVSDIECEKALKDGIVLAASKLRNNPPSTQYGLTLNYLKALLESNKSSILVKSDNDIKKISFEDSLPLFTDYFAKINTQTDKTSNEKDVVFHTEPNDPTKVSVIESDKSFMEELRFKANKMFENPSLDTFSLTYNSLKSSIENDNRRLFIQSTEDKKQISFEDSLPLFTDYFAKINTQTDKTSNEKDVVFHTEPNDPTKVSAIESDKFFMDELRFKANKMFENPSLDTFNLTYNSLKSSIENDNRRLLIQSTEDKKQISFEEALPLFSDYMASLNLNANKDTPLVTTFGIEPGATDPATIKKDNIRCLY